MSIISIKLSKVLTPKEFKKLQNELWEYFGDIGKDDITIDSLLMRE